MEEKTTIQVTKVNRDRLDAMAKRKEPLNNVIEGLLNTKQENKETGIFETAKVPDNGRVRLTKAGGKTIEWRIKE